MDASGQAVDEKSQIQARDRTQPGLPLKKGRGATMTHDYKRNGTTTLFAALNVLDGTVIGQNMARHRHQEFIRFLNRIERAVPAGSTIHVILDNYAAHKHEKVQAWLARHPRWTFHFTPISCSWLNAVEGFFAKLTRRRLKHGVFHSVGDLQAAINRFVGEYNVCDAKPFIWRAHPDNIIVRLPDRLDRRRGNASRLRHRAQRPVGCFVRRRLLCQADDLGDTIGRDRSLAGRTRLVAKQSVDAFVHEPLLPAFRSWS